VRARAILLVPHQFESHLVQLQTSSAIFHRRFRSGKRKNLDKEHCHGAWYGSKYVRSSEDLLRQQWHYSTLIKTMAL
jgi:hypothetical protein